MRFLTPKDLGALVKEARISAGMTQAQLGEKIGASRFWVAEFERGKSGAEIGLALKALRALKLVLSVEPKDVASRREQEQQPAEQHPAELRQPTVDLSSIVNRSTAPVTRSLESDPFRIYDWTISPSTAESTQGTEHHRERPMKKRKRGK